MKDVTFSLDDEDSFYCTQLIDKVFRELKAGIVLDRHFLKGYEMDVILIEELTRGEYFNEILYFDVNDLL